MAFLIEGREMPKNCISCYSNNTHVYIHMLVGCPYIKEAFHNYNIKKERHPDCPLIEVPEPHGRLIDADALHKLFEDQWHYLQVLDWNENPTAEAKQSGINWCINTMHDDTPAVIPASKEG